MKQPIQTTASLRCTTLQVGVSVGEGKLDFSILVDDFLADLVDREKIEDEEWMSFSGPLRIKSRGEEEYAGYASVQWHEHEDKNHHWIVVSFEALSKPRKPKAKTPQARKLFRALGRATGGKEFKGRIVAEHVFQREAWAGATELPVPLPFDLEEHGSHPAELIGVQVGIQTEAGREVVLLSADPEGMELKVSSEIPFRATFSEDFLNEAFGRSEGVARKLMRPAEVDRAE